MLDFCNGFQTGKWNGCFCSLIWSYRLACIAVLVKFLGWLLLIKPVSMSARPQKVYSDLNEIWYVGRGWWVLHDGMPYDRTQGQRQGHGGIQIHVLLTYLFLHATVCGAVSWRRTWSDSSRSCRAADAWSRSFALRSPVCRSATAPLKVNCTSFDRKTRVYSRSANHALRLILTVSCSK